MQSILRNEQILIIGFPAWEGEYLKSTVQLAAELAKENDVLYVEYPFTWKDALMGRLGKSKAPWKRILGKEERLRKLTLDNGAEINVLTLPPMLPVNFIDSEIIYDALMLGNAKKAFQSIKVAMQHLGMDRPVVLNAFNPFLGVFLARQFNEKALIYYCYDEISAAKWAGKHGARLEQHFMQEADAVITSSQPLFDAKQQSANQIYLVKNGVDFDLFNQATISGKVEKKNEKTKVVGYLGSLDERLDYELLKSTIASLPDTHFCFVGRVNSPEVEQLRKFDNVEIVGSQSPASLPGWVQKFDVCMIPFVKNKLTSGIYPLKINEYFAVGKPVVTTNFSDLSDFQHLTGIASDSNSFAGMLTKMMEDDNPGLVKSRIAFAKQNSWRKKAIEMGKAITTVLVGNEEIEQKADFVRMPNNFNRWGEVSDSFFQSKNTKTQQQDRVTPNYQDQRRRSLNVKNLEVFLPEHKVI